MNDKKTSEERKLISEKYLEELGFKVNHNLPLVEDFNTAKFQTARNIAIRTQILGALTETAFELGRTECEKYLKDIEVWDYVSPSEREYLATDEPDERVVIDMSWRIEANYVLFWSLGYTNKPVIPSEPIELHDIYERIRSEFESVNDFFNSAKLRETEEILDECDLI